MTYYNCFFPPKNYTPIICVYFYPPNTDMQPNLRSRILLVLILFLMGVFIYFPPPSEPLSQVCCNSTCFSVELAQTSAKRQNWLMYRSSLPEDVGMLFIFDQEDTHSFRMKNTLIPLDMLRLNANREIVDIQQAEPCTSDPCPSYLPSTSAQYVLELNQGISRRSWIEIWNQCFLTS